MFFSVGTENADHAPWGRLLYRRRLFEKAPLHVLRRAPPWGCEPITRQAERWRAEVGNCGTKSSETVHKSRDFWRSMEHLKRCVWPMILTNLESVQVTFLIVIYVTRSLHGTIMVFVAKILSLKFTVIKSLQFKIIFASVDTC